MSSTDICTTNGRAPLFVEASSFCMEHYCQKGATKVLHCRFKCKTFIMEVLDQKTVKYFILGGKDEQPGISFPVEDSSN